MELLRNLFGSVQEIAQNAIPDPQELMDNALQGTSVDETVQQFIETPQDTAQQAIDSFGQEMGL